MTTIGSPYCSYDLERDVLTFDDVEFTGEFLRAFSQPDPDVLFWVEGWQPMAALRS